MGKIDYFDNEHLSSDLRSRAVMGAGATFSAQVLSFGIQTVGGVILARLLTPTDFGLVAMALTASLLLQNFGVNGFTEAVIQAAEIDHRQMTTLFWINVACSMVLALVFLASAPLVARFYQEPRLKAIVMIMSSTILFAGLSVQHGALLRRTMQFAKTSGIGLAASAIGNAIPIAMAWLGFGYWSLTARWVLLPLATTVGSWMLCDWRPGLPARKSRVIPLVRFASHTYGNFVMTYARRTVDKVLLGRVYGSEALGAYDRAFQLSSMVPAYTIMPVYSVAVSAFSRVRGDPVRYRMNYLYVLSVLSFVTMPLSAIVPLCASDIVLVLLGPRWNAATAYFVVFGVSIGVTAVYITHGWLHLSLGTPDRWFRWSVLELGVTIVCFAVGSGFGALGVAVAYSTSCFALVGPGLWYAGKPIELKMSAVFASVGRHLLAAVVAGVSSWAALYRVGPVRTAFSNWDVWIRLAMASSLCVSVYLVAVLVLFRGVGPIADCVSLGRMVLKKRRASRG